MRKNRLCLTMAAVLCASVFGGCQKAPGATEGNDIVHAQGDIERQVQIATTDTQGQTQAGSRADEQEQTADWYQGSIGTGDNKININAAIPAVPDNLCIITLGPNGGLNRDALLEFLDSESDSIKDTSQELLNEIEENDRYNSTPQENEDRCLYSKFGDHSAARLGDGAKEASFTYHTGAYYINHELKEKCVRIFSGNFSETLITQDKMDEGSFPANKAVEILLDKAEAAGVSELSIRKVYYKEGNGYSFYEMEFVPVYDGIAVDIGTDAYALGQVWPNGFASVSEEGVAEVTLIDFCGKAVDKEPVTLLSFEQILKILEQYLDNGMIESQGKITYDRVELNYYPVPNSAPAPDEIEYKPELLLTPIWHIYIPLDEYVDEGYAETSEPAHICVDAVTGELVKTD